MGNRYIAAGRCPFCYGSGWIDTVPCEDCAGTGTLAGMWDHHAETLNVRREFVEDGSI